MGDSSINSEASSGKRVRERWNEAGVPADVVNDAIAYVQMTGSVLSEADFCASCDCMTEHGSNWMVVTSLRQTLVVDKAANLELSFSI